MGRSGPSRFTAAVAFVALLFATVVAVITAASPAGATSTFSNSSAITINDSNAPPTKATPYGSGIAVSGLTGTTTKVTVTLSGVSHTAPGDIDAMVVAPNGANAEVMSDSGDDSPISNLTFTFDDAGASSLPAGSQLSGGTFKPTNNGVGADTFPSPAPTPSGNSALSVFNGGDPNGTWNLFVVDDTFGDSGTIAGGWSMSIDTAAATLSSISVAPSSPSVTLGGSQQFTATGHYSDASTADLSNSVTWSSGTPAVASVSTTGKATGLTVGSSAITATLGAVSGNTTLSVNAQSGTTNTNPITINDSSSPPTAATSYPSPILISGLANPVSNVTVTLSGVTHPSSNDIDAMLVGPAGQNILLMSDAGTSASNSNLTFDDAAGPNLPASGEIPSGTYKPTNYGSGDAFPAPAPTPSGATALSSFDNTDGNGYWNLYVVDDDFGDAGSIAGWTLNITTAAASLTSIDVTPANPTVTPGGYQQFTATGTLSPSGTIDLTNSATWTSSDPSVATISSTGKLLALTVGTTTVSAQQGAVTGSQPITITANPANTNPNPITINDSASAPTPGSPYPSTITESGFAKNIAALTVTLNGVTHTNPADIDVLLVGPAGQNVLLMSDAGGSTAVSGANLTFSDAAASLLPSSGPISSGTYKATNYGSGDTFPAPAPAPSAATDLTGFLGTSPNGVWKLFVVDDALGDSGSITGGWSLNITTPTLQSIAVTPANPSILKGATQQFTATGTYSDSSTADLTSTATWGSGTPATATITTGGLATGVNTGTSSISATLGPVSGSTVLTVTAPTLQSIAVTPANPSIAKGATQQFTATGTYSDNSTADLTSTATWASATPATATITTGGLATGVNTGTSSISATLGPVSGSTVLTVTAPTLQSIAVTPANPSIAKGATQQFTATGTYSDSSTADLTSTATWASATPATATITTGGLATGVNTGTSSISATLGPVSGSTVLTVTAPTLQSIAVTPANPSIAKGATQQFTATGTYSDNSTADLTSTATWASATPATATITTGGLATGVNTGTSSISATLGPVSGSTVLTVTPPAGDTLHGTVRDSVFNAAVGGVNVRLWVPGASTFAFATTTSLDGTYLFTNVPFGSYQVQFAKSLSYITSWNNEAPLRTGATPVAITGGSDVEIDQTLTPGVTITGQVTDSSSHAGLGQVTVLALKAGTQSIVANTVTDNTGNYTFGRFPYGAYDLEFIKFGYVVQYFNGSADQANATHVTVSAASGSPVANAAIVASAVNTGAVSGTVTDQTTTLPIAGVNVRIWRTNTQTYISATTNALGQYTIANIPPGSYEVQFAKAGAYNTRWYNGVDLRASAGHIVLGQGSQVAIDQTLQHS